MALNKSFNFMDDISFGETVKSEETAALEETKKRETRKPDTDKPVKAVTKKTNYPIDMLKIDTTKPERMEVHKSFLIKPSLNEKFTAYAKKQKISENALFNKILEKIFEE